MAEQEEEGIGKKGYGWRKSLDVFGRVATFGYGNWGERLPRGDLECGAL
jgi:hypothetical protein